jgi:hypothetical protein
VTHEQFLKLMKMVNLAIEYGWHVEFRNGLLLLRMD